jgi:hypothetical protein
MRAASVSMDPRDQRIVEIVASLATGLGLRKFPHRVVWRESVELADSPRGMETWVGSDDCFVLKDKIVLPERMRDRLGPEEWRPIIASALVLRLKMRRKVLTKIFTRLMLPPIASLALSIAFFIQGLDSTGTFAGPFWVELLMLFSLIACVFVPRVLYGRYFQSAKLVADREAAELVGRGAFLEVLSKIETMKLEDVEDYAKGKWHSGETRLAITKRISNLQNYT